MSSNLTKEQLLPDCSLNSHYNEQLPVAIQFKLVLQTGSVCHHTLQLLVAQSIIKLAKILLKKKKKNIKDKGTCRCL